MLQLQVCSLHQAETAAAQRIQGLESYLREVRSYGTRSAIVAVVEPLFRSPPIKSKLGKRF